MSKTISKQAKAAVRARRRAKRIRNKRDIITLKKNDVIKFDSGYGTVVRNDFIRDSEGQGFYVTRVRKTSTI